MDRLDAILQKARTDHDFTTVDGKAAALRACLDFARRLPHGLERMLTLRRISDALDIGAAPLAQHMKEQGDG